MTRFVFLASFAAAACMSSGAMAQANLVTNGNFSQFTISGGDTVPATAGFEPGVNGTLTDWTSSGYNFLYQGQVQSGTTSVSAAEWGSFSGNGTSNYVGLYDHGTTTTVTTALGSKTLSNAAAASNTWNGNGPVNPAGGTFNYIAMDGDYNSGAMSTTISNLTSGTVYAVTYWFAFAQQNTYTGSTYQNVQVSWGTGAQEAKQYAITSGTIMQSPTATNTNNTNAAFTGLYGYQLCSQCFSGWTQQTVYFEANSAQEVLAFLALGNVQEPPFALISDISMVAAPEPASVGAVLAGAAGMLLARRRARQRG